MLRNNDLNYTLKKNIVRVIKNYDAIPIGIISDELEKVKEVIDLCDGFILQGGIWYTKSDIDILRYLYIKDIPILGICLGMQMMGVLLGGKLKEIGNINHQSENDYVHKIYLQKNSKIKNIIDEEQIIVNSRHIHNVVDINLKYVGAYSEDRLIEEIEDDTKSFFVGVQWHPEIIYEDKNSIKLFNSFFAAINKKDVNN